MRAPRHYPNERRFGDHLGGEISQGGTRDGGADEPAARGQVGDAGGEEGGGMGDVLEDFEEGEHVRSSSFPGLLLLLLLAEVFDAGVEIVEFGRRKGGVGALVGFCHREDGGGRIDGGDGEGGGETGGGFGEDSAAAADVEVGSFVVVVGAGWGPSAGGEAGVDEGVAEGVHQVEEAGGAMGVPPGGGEEGEVG